MTGLENILSGIKEESDLKISKILSDAQKASEEISDFFKKEAEKSYERILKDAEALSKDIVKRAESKADLEAKKIILNKKREIIDSVIADAKESLKNKGDEEYFDILSKIIDKNAHKDEGEIILSSSDKERMSDEFKAFLKNKNLKVSEKSKEGIKGCILVYGEIEENLSFDAIFESMYEGISDKACQLMFE